jgi:DNA-binding NtrC family response regulator
MNEGQWLDESHLVRKIRDTIRRWWRLEIAFADVKGYVADHARGVVVPPHNIICKATLGSAEGFKRCNRSVQQASARLQEWPGDGARLVEPCHMGFPQLIAPVSLNGEFHGSIFTGGFLVDTGDSSILETIASNAVDLNLPIELGPETTQSIPILTEQDLKYLCDLINLCVVELETMISERKDRRAFGDLIGNSPPMRRLYGVLEKVAMSDATVLVTGENGTGKEVVAKAIRNMGNRQNEAFVVTNCSALNDHLLESELFGHVRGAFTGAIRNKDGLFGVAHNGTLFLDEVGDTSPAMQVKLLRVLQEGTFMPVGATEPKTVNVRIIAATNRPLLDMVQRGEFREDLYYRLCVINVDLPPLRERKSDLPTLCDHFMEKVRRKSNGRRKTLSAEVMERFWEYEWPGNVRQLENEIERLIVLSGDDTEIGVSGMSPAVAAAVPSARVDENVETLGSMEEAILTIQRRMIHSGLIRTGWNKSRLARELGLSRTTLIKKIRELGLEESRSIIG